MNSSNAKDVIDQFFDSLEKIQGLHSSDIPGIQLYMDQVTTFMEEHLGRHRRDLSEKVLTKTMINNYTKHHLLPPPEKKKYSREHMLILIFIYYYKTILPLQDIRALLEPLTERYFGKEGNDGEVSLQDIYDEVIRISADEIASIKADVERLYDKSMQTFSEIDESERDFLQIFVLISSLTLDVYIKKEMISQLIDQYFQSK